MRRIIATIIVVLGVLLAGLPPQAAQAASHNIDIPTGGGIPLAVRTTSTYVAWAEEIQPNRFSRYVNIHVALLANGQQILELGQLNVSNYDAQYGATFALGDGVLVWRDGTSGQSPNPLKAIDLQSGEAWVLAENSGFYPSIAGGNVSWWDISPLGDAPATARLMVRPLRGAATPTELLHLGLEHSDDLRDSRMSDTWVAWVQADAQPGGQYGCPTLYAVRTDGSDQQLINDVVCHDDQRVPFDLYGERLAYVDRYNLLVERNPPTGEVRRSGPHANIDLAIASRYMFWNSAAIAGIQGYDPATNSTFPVSTASAASPTVGEDTLAWFEQARTGGYIVRVQPINTVLPSSPRSATAAAAAGRAFFPETWHSLGGEFRNFWLHNGGLAVFGFPLTEEFMQQNASNGADYTVQYLERQRFEFHPENTGTPYVVLLGRLGAEALAAQGRDWQTLPKASPNTTHYFAATGQAIAPEFWEYWRTHGLELGDRGVSEREALALWGYPLTPPSYETLPTGETLLVQWFERARFEYHPNNPAPYRVLLGRLAADNVASFGWQ